MGEIKCQHDDIAKAFTALSRPVWEFLISLMAKQIILKVKLIYLSSNLIVDEVIYSRNFSHTFGKIYCKYILSWHSRRVW